MAETAWAIVPPLITILLALVTKEVFLSLTAGIFVGALIYTHFQFLAAADTMFSIMNGMIDEHTYVLIFFVLLGILVEEISCSGASRAYGSWAAGAAHGKRSALFLTMGLGIVIFIDDYFNCVTVGDAMKKVTDHFKVTRVKLAYIIDATAAPVCCIAPVSTWAAVSSAVPTTDESVSFSLFLQTIPFNFYAWLTLLFMAFLVWSGRDFLTMGEHERPYPETDPEDDDEESAACGEGALADLFLPILVLLAAVLACLLYNGGWHWGGCLKTAFDASDPGKGMATGTFIALLFTSLLYRVRHVMGYKQITECISMGFVNMTSSIFVLCLSWTLAGAVGGGHVSPLSSTTILASAGAGCRHADHVNTQIPYVAVVALASFAGYLAAGLFENGWMGLAVSAAALVVLCLYLLHDKGNRKDIFRRVEIKGEEEE